MQIDDWFKTVREKYSAHMQCGKGCTACCHGLFDISLADAVDVARGFQRLSPDLQERVYSRAAALYGPIRENAPENCEAAAFTEDDPVIDRIVDMADSPPCPCLGDAGECLIYDYRPQACRLEGVPMVDVRDGLFGTWCELNFKEGIPESALADLRQDYDMLDAVQESRSAAVARKAGFSDPRAVTFIPAVIVESDRFWKPLLRGEGKMGT